MKIITVESGITHRLVNDGGSFRRVCGGYTRGKVGQVADMAPIYGTLCPTCWGGRTAARRPSTHECDACGADLPTESDFHTEPDGRDYCPRHCPTCSRKGPR